MKGQKSLEMIIGLIMLLVVASVTISMFLNVFQEPKLGKDTVQKQQIKNQCQSKCSAFKESSGQSQLSAALEYCTAKFTRDVDNDGTTTDVAGAGYNSYCENGIKCFNVHTCEIGIGEELDAQKCRKLMCEYYTKVNKDPYSPSEPNNVHKHIRDIFSPENEETGVGTCGLGSVTDSAGYELATWYNPRKDNFTIAGDLSQEEYVCPPSYSNSGSGNSGVCSGGWCWTSSTPSIIKNNNNPGSYCPTASAQNQNLYCRQN